MRLLTVFSRKAHYRSCGATPAEIISQATWRKSSFSSMNGNCVEVGHLLPDRVGVRDTKDKGTGPVLIFTGAEWDAFIAGAKEGQFD
jgi:Domain of unknown function (DUF397)